MNTLSLKIRLLKKNPMLLSGTFMLTRRIKRNQKGENEVILANVTKVLRLEKFVKLNIGVARFNLRGNPSQAPHHVKAVTFLKLFIGLNKQSSLRLRLAKCPSTCY